MIYYTISHFKLLEPRLPAIQRRSVCNKNITTIIYFTELDFKPSAKVYLCLYKVQNIR